MLIPVPRFSTVTDVVHHHPRGTELSLPSDPALWAALLAAIHNSPSEAQAPPLFVLEDAASNESFTINQNFFRAFIEAWDEDRTHVVTVSHVDGGVRTFRSAQRFWRFLATCAEQAVFEYRTAGSLPALARDGLTIVSNLQPAAPVRLLPDTWARVVDHWNQMNEQTSSAAAGGSAARPHDAVLVPDTLTGLIPVSDKPAADDEYDAGGAYEGERRRPRSHAVIDPSTTVDDAQLEAIARRFSGPRRRGVDGQPPDDSRYWTHFMRQWGVLRAQYRNYM
jgi:hypothetical protein